MSLSRFRTTADPSIKIIHLYGPTSKRKVFNPRFKADSIRFHTFAPRRFVRQSPPSPHPLKPYQVGRIPIQASIGVCTTSSSTFLCILLLTGHLKPNDKFEGVMDFISPLVQHALISLESKWQALDGNNKRNF